MSTESLLAEARAWLRQDPDHETRDQLAGIITLASGGDAAAASDLADRFSTRLAFGTAGLRGELGAGPNRMNRVLVAQAAAGFAGYLLDRADGSTPTVVIGYDGRRNSRRFAEDSAELFAGAGLRAILLPRLLPTPVLAFAVRHLGADAGVMVTASHNPPNDNGYKVYLGGADDGSQIVSPADAEIAAHIQRVADAGDVSALTRSTTYEVAGEDVLDAYVTATAAVSPAGSAAGLKWVYTAMHGVGWETVSRVVRAAGYPQPTVVRAQQHPDATFRTVSFPNPEEPGAMNLAFDVARSARAELIIANDPDADRLAVAIPDSAAPGGWRRLSGNEVGLLLGARAARAAEGTDGATLACSLVSSPGLGAIAAHHGLGFAETLTGFKWISRAEGIVFGFEEALGYLVNPGTVRDKDGISAAIALLGLATDAKERGETLADLLADLGETYGHFASGQVSIRVEDLSIIARVMASLRASTPATIGDLAVTSAEDLLHAAPGTPSGDVLRYRLDGGSRVIVRPSGTEPKLKVYIDAQADSSENAAATVSAIETGVRTLLEERS